MISQTTAESIEFAEHEVPLSTVSNDCTSCSCCMDDLDSRTKTDDYETEEKTNEDGSHETIVRMDGKVACFPGCAACCHALGHQFCQSRCGEHAHTTDANKAAALAALMHDPQRTSSTLSLNGVEDDEAERTHTHLHDTLRYRAVYKTRPGATVTPATDTAPDATLAADSGADNKLPSLSFTDRWLTVIILGAMALGVLIGYFSPSSADNINHWSTGTINWPIAIGLIAMMTPPLARVNYDQIYRMLRNKRAIPTPVPAPACASECITAEMGASTLSASSSSSSAADVPRGAVSDLSDRRLIYKMFGISLVLNWVVGPLLMFFIAVASLPDMPHYIRGLIFVGLARCIAMVVLWSYLANGSPEFTAILVCLNSAFQIVMYSPYAYVLVTLFLPALNLPSMSDMHDSDVNVGFVLILESVAIYLGIPFAIGFLCWSIIPRFTGSQWYNEVFVKWTAPLTLLALLYTIVLLFVIKAHAIVVLPTDILRICVPLLIYFGVMFAGTFYGCWKTGFSFPETVTLAFTAASNNFELAIAVAVATFGIDSPEPLAAVCGPLVEVPAMLACVLVARRWRSWFPADKLKSAIDAY